jgi:hypothetical protein
MIALPLFEMLQPRVDQFLNPMQFGTPGILRVIEPLIDGVESSIDMSPQISKAGIEIGKAGIEIAQPRVVDEDSHKYCDRGNANRKGDLNCLIGHRYPQNTPF